jgi:hypothetical protein
MTSAGLTPQEIGYVKIWSSDYPKVVSLSRTLRYLFDLFIQEFPICGSWILPATRFVIQNDDDDQQNSGSSSRDMGDKVGQVFAILSSIFDGFIGTRVLSSSRTKMLPNIEALKSSCSLKLTSLPMFAIFCLLTLFEATVQR